MKTQSHIQLQFTHTARLVLGLLGVLGAVHPLSAALLLKQNFNSSNSWSAMSGYFSAGGGTVTATPSYGAVGTIDTINTGTSSNGLQLSVNSSAATGNWTAGLTSGVQPLLTTTTQGREFITLAFSLSASSAFPVRVKIESYNSSSVRTGGLARLIYPAAPDFYQRYAIDLDTMTADGAGTFNPADPRVQISFELDSTANAGTSWPAAAGHVLKIDNINLATPKYYVSPTGNNSSNGLTPGTAFLTVQKAADQLRTVSAGVNSDNIIAIMSGADYIGTNSNGAMVLVTETGTPDDWIVFKNFPGHTPVLRPNGWEGFKLTNNNDGGVGNAASYVEIRGLTIRGLSSFDANGDRQIDPAYQSTVGFKQGPSNGNAISIDGRNNALKPRHFRIADNVTEFMPGAGINVLAADRVAVENNLSRYNCWWMVYAGSGINFFEILDTEIGSSYRMLMRDNVVYGNETMVPWFPSSGQFSDGNGLILDTYSLTYTGRTLMANNLVYNNGGSGVHILQASNVDAIHNTSYMNSASPNLAYTQLDTQSTCNNIRMTNNIGVAPRNTTGVTSGSTAFLFNEPVTAVSTFNSSNIVHLKNVYAGGDITPVATALGANNLDLGRAYNPANLFISPSTNPAVADFRLRAGVAPLNYGAAVGYRGVRDLAGTPRPLTGSSDTGVYQLVTGLAYSPVVNVASGNYFGTTQTITLSSDTAGATIVYTTNGSTPTVNGSGASTNGTVYTSALPISADTTLKAIAWKSGLGTSPVTTAIYEFTNLSTLPCSLELWTRAANGNGQKLTDINSPGLTSSTIHSGTRSIQGLSRTPGAAMRYIDETISGAVNPTPTTGTPQEYRGYSVIDYAQVRYGAFKPGRANSSILSAEITIRAAMGNTANGDTLVTTGANTIRYVRFLNTETFSSAYIFARINGITGNYRAAIYAESSNAPSTLAAQSALVTNPTTGWTAFPLNARTTLLKDKYYWLAIWSDSASAGIYSTTTGSTLREQASTFSSTWPTSATTSAVAATNQYAIYTTNSPPNNAPAANAGPNQTGAANVTLSVNGTVGDDGVPVAPGAVTQLWTKISGPGTVTFGDATSAATTAIFSSTGSYVLRLTASDALSSAFDEVIYDIGTGAGSLDPAPPAGGVRARFSDGVGTTFPQQYAGVAGDGWAAAWTLSSLNTGTTVLTANSNATATVLSASPLLTGAGNYLQVTRTGGSGSTPVVGVSRQWSSTARPTGASGPAFTRLTFSYRIDSNPSVFASTSDIHSISINSVAGPGPGNATNGDATIHIAAFGAKPTTAASLVGQEWGVYNGATDTTYSSSKFRRFPITNNVGMAATPGTTYTFTVDIYASNAAGTTNGKTHGTYDVTVSDGTTTKTLTSSRFRNLGYTAGPYLAFATQQSNSTDNLAFSVDSIEMSSLPTIATTTIVTSDTNPANPGNLITYTATVTGSPGIPNGSVTFYNGAIPIGTSALNESGIATFSTSALSSGPHDITAIYANSSTHLGSTSTVLSQMIRAASNTALVSNPNPANAGASVTLIATVTGDAAIPTGTVTFFDAATPLGSATLDASGVATFTTTSLAAGLRSLSASYAGSSIYGNSVSDLLDQSIRPTTTTTLISSANPSSEGIPVIFTATVASTTGTPDGEVSFYDGPTLLGTATLNSAGVATFTTSTLTNGSHSITATYGSTSGYQGSTSTALSQTVLAASATSITSSLNPGNPNNPITFTATVTGSTTTPTGSVTFLDGVSPLGTGLLDGNGIATFSTSSLASGSRSITATYTGDSSYGSSTSAALVQIVRIPTSITLTSSANPANSGEAVTLTASVSSAASGTVTFFDGSTQIGTASLNASSVATLAVSNLTSGPHVLTARYAESATHLASISNSLNQVIRASTTTSITSSANPVGLNSTVTFSATVASSSGTPDGIVTFFNGATSLGTGTLNGSGVATLTNSTLSQALGTFSITASYAPTSNYAASVSTPLSLQVTSGESTPAGVVRARFTDGNGTLTAQQYPGTAGDGWLTAWTPVVGTASVSSSIPTLGGGSYLQASRASGSGSTSQAGVYRQWDGATRPYNKFSRLTFSFRIDSDAKFENSGDAYTISINSALGTVPGTITSAYLRCFGGSPGQDAAGNAILPREWYIFNGTPGTADNYSTTRFRRFPVVGNLGMPATPGTTYTVTLDVYAADTSGMTGGKTHGTYDVTITDGTNTKTSLGSGFRSAAYTSGGFISVASQQNLTDDNLAFSLDTIELTSLPTITTLSTSATPVVPGSSITFTAVVSVPGGTSIPSGTVTFLDGSTPIGTGTLSASGIATLTTSALAAGPHPITASYATDSNHSSSVSSVINQVVRQPTSTSLTSSANPANLGAAVTFSATVAGGNPGDTVNFFDGATTIGSGVLTAGTATLSISTLAAGQRSITATYAATASTAASSSAILTQTIQNLSPYDAWLVGFFSSTVLANPALEATVWGKQADPDGDGLSNLLEYALELSPTVGNPLPSGMNPSTVPLGLTFKRARAELSYIVQGTNDLQSWQDIATNPFPVGTTGTVFDTAPASEVRRLLRLKVIQP